MNNPLFAQKVIKYFTSQTDHPLKLFLTTIGGVVFRMYNYVIFTHPNALKRVVYTSGNYTQYNTMCPSSRCAKSFKKLQTQQ